MQNNDQLLQNLASKAKNGSDEAFEQILKILDKDIKKLANKYYIVGSDSNDVLQECRIGVWKAVKDYDDSAGMSFKNFSLNLCCKRHLITAMSHANTQKFKLQNESISLSAPVSNSDDDGVQTYADYIPDLSFDLLDDYVIKEEFDTNLTIISDQLTNLEMSIFNQYSVNSSYKDIAKALGVKTKTVDNALMRIRKKASTVYKVYNSGVFLGMHSTDITAEMTEEIGFSGAIIHEISFHEESFSGIGSSFCF
jgi:RNA polymerase sporulation-specific sigma factor